MSGKIEISRELAEHIIFGLESKNYGINWAGELRALLAAPVVERQPVAWMYKREGGECLGQLVQMESDDLKVIREGRTADLGPVFHPREDYIDWKPLYAEQPAPVAVVLPDRNKITMTKPLDAPPGYALQGSMAYELQIWQACIDMVEKLNP